MDFKTPALEDQAPPQRVKGRPSADGLRSLFSGNLHGFTGERIECLACHKTFAASFLRTTTKLREHVSRCPNLDADVRMLHGPEGAAPKRRRLKEDHEDNMLLLLDGDEEGLSPSMTVDGLPEAAPRKPRARGTGTRTIVAESRSSSDLAAVVFTSSVPAAFLNNVALQNWMRVFGRSTLSSVANTGALEKLVVGMLNICHGALRSAV